MQKSKPFDTEQHVLFLRSSSFFILSWSGMMMILYEQGASHIFLYKNIKDVCTLKNIYFADIFAV